MHQNFVSALYDKFPGRKQQIDTLVRLVGKPSVSSFPAIFIYGLPSTGKTSIIKELFKAVPPSNVAYINCVECLLSTRALFETALNEWTGILPSEENGYKGFGRCDSVCDFARKVQDIIPEYSKTKYLILDQVEHIRDLSPSLLSTLLSLAEYCRRNICIIMLSTVVWEKFRSSKFGAHEPFLVHFSQYTRDETINILQRDRPADEDPVFYSRFTEMVYDAFDRSCRNLTELRYLCQLLFPVYIKPVLEAKIQQNQTVKLYRYMDSHFKQAASKLFLREISTGEWLNQVNRADNPSFLQSPKPTFSNTVELPTISRYLLVASFLASYNPARLDSRLFAKGGQGARYRKRVGKNAARKEKTGGRLRQQLQGPKSFPFERMLAIFYSVLDDPIANTVDIQKQISTLISRQLLVRTTPLDKLDSMKCKCNVSYDTIKRVAESLKFPIGEYLYDFLE